MSAQRRRSSLSKFSEDFPRPPETLPRSPGHWVEWVNFAKGQGPGPGSNFQYSGWTTEASHLGNVAYRTGKKIEWDYASGFARVHWFIGEGSLSGIVSDQGSPPRIIRVAAPVSLK